jgi:CRISPR-associated endonuclease/helicase Cas3
MGQINHYSMTSWGRNKQMVDLYAYQRRVYDALKRGRNVIVQAPTGSGKTLAALYPFLEQLDHYASDQTGEAAATSAMPLTCRYAVPMRVLASQFEREYRAYIERLDEKRGVNLWRRYTDGLGVNVPAIQTGETPDDRAFESPLTFCTIDQLLSSFIGAPYSLAGRQANLNVGAVVGSYLILDEFHLYPFEKGNGARVTTLAMLRLLKGVSRFVLMTATFSSTLLDKLSQLLDADVIRVTELDEFREIMGTRGRTVRLSATSLSAEVVLAAHQAARARDAPASLVVLNTVAEAQALYERLRDAMAGSDTRVMLLHSRFTQEDRQAKSRDLEEWLGQANWANGRYLDQSTIVVATQVVEVGLNISAGVLHTELAPANSLIQRVGRCARFADQRGEVTVYHPLAPERPEMMETLDPQTLAAFGASDDEGESGGATRRKSDALYLPYDRETSEATWTCLVQRYEENGGAPFAFSFAEEQALIDAVHTDADKAMLVRFMSDELRINDTIKDALTTHEAGANAELIRDVANLSVIIHDNPEAITTRPYDWDAFSIPPGTLLKHWNELLARKEALELGWVMKSMTPDTESDTESDNSRELRYVWTDVRHEAHAACIMSSLRLALPSQLATYDKHLGFSLLIGAEAQSTGWTSQPHLGGRGPRELWGGKQRSYVEHITGLKRAYDWSVRREVAWVARRLEAELRLTAGSVDEAVRLAIACHDIGKLSRDWQRWARAWQALLTQQNAGYAVRADRVFLAKTDRLSDWQQERAVRDRLRADNVRRPNHSCVGVIAAGRLIATYLLERSSEQPARSALTKVTWSAIARHHAPTATEYDQAEWDSAARAVIGEALAACGVAAPPERLELLTLAATPCGKLPGDYLLAPSFDLAESSDLPRLATWLGFVIVRALRLCDQRADRDL